MAQHAEQMQRIKVPRVMVKDLGVEHLGGGKVVGPVQFDGPPEQLAEIEERLGCAHRDDSFGGY